MMSMPGMPLSWLLGLTVACGAAFLVNKGIEWGAKFHHGIYPNGPALAHSPPGEALFFGLYFVMTGLHGLHVLAGMAVIGWIMLRASRGEFGPKYFNPVDFVGLYWHVVDIVWIFLFPLLYLIH